MYVANGLREHRGGGQYLYLVVALYGGAIYGIGGYQQLYGALLDLLYSLFPEHYMGQECVNVVCALVLEAVRNVYQSTAGDGEIVYHYTVFALYVADYLKHLGVLVVAGARLISYGHGAAKLVGHHPCALCAARIGGYHYQVVVHYAQIPCVCAKQVLGVKVIHGLLEKALHLSGMKIHGHDAVRARQLYALRAHPAAY